MIDDKKYIKIISSQSEKQNPKEAVAEAVINSVTINPSTELQVITVPDGVDGYNPITVNAVTSDIDSNIIASNIKSGVSILGVTGDMPILPTYYIEKTVDNGTLKNSSHLIDLSGFTNVGSYVLSHACWFNTAITGSIVFSNLTQLTNGYECDCCFQSCLGITSVSMPLLSVVSGVTSAQAMFAGCTGITSADLHSLTTVSGQNGCGSMFNSCSNLASIDISSLTTISGVQGCYALVSNSKITSVDLSNLTTISGKWGCQSMFNATKIVSVNFSSLSTITGDQACQSMFSNCSDLTTLSFPALKTTSFGSYTNQFSNLILRCSNVTIHFPSNLQSVVSGLTGYPDFGGTNTTILFDLTETE